mmetsp:Transcript_105156/g.272329  ORF Transcript_105156/g.272329 Transcript_105156/m.272329 type:complete len:323 (-) Transcript_105156:1595-2563(-)
MRCRGSGSRCRLLALPLFGLHPLREQRKTLLDVPHALGKRSLLAAEVAGVCGCALAEAGQAALHREQATAHGLSIGFSSGEALLEDGDALFGPCGKRSELPGGIPHELQQLALQTLEVAFRNLDHSSNLHLLHTIFPSGVDAARGTARRRRRHRRRRCRGRGTCGGSLALCHLSSSGRCLCVRGGGRAELGEFAAQGARSLLQASGKLLQPPQHLPPQLLHPHVDSLTPGKAPIVAAAATPAVMFVAGLAAFLRHRTGAFLYRCTGLLLYCPQDLSPQLRHPAVYHLLGCLFRRLLLALAEAFADGTQLLLHDAAYLSPQLY